jgi:hypothetical protein
LNDDSEDSPQSESLPNDDHWDVDDHRFSRDYQFTIASPDEEMHGKAVALFDFARENDNELPLTEGQVVLVSYRNGEGWLVAQDPKTGESGLIPEEYVRLLRDIEGGWNGLMNGPDFDSGEAKTPTQESQSQFKGAPNNLDKEYYQPVVSTFSTSREDFLAHRLGSPLSASTPTEYSRRGSEDIRLRNLDGAKFEDDNQSPLKDVSVKTTEVHSSRDPE